MRGAFGLGSMESCAGIKERGSRAAELKLRGYSI